MYKEWRLREDGGQWFESLVVERYGEGGMGYDHARFIIAWEPGRMIRVQQTEWNRRTGETRVWREEHRVFRVTLTSPKDTVIREMHFLADKSNDPYDQMRTAAYNMIYGMKQDRHGNYPGRIIEKQSSITWDS